MHSDQELNDFKAQINLSEYAATKGYRIDKSRSTPNSVSMKRDDDRIVIAKNENRHWIYFTVGSSMDNGTIIDFVMNRSSKNMGEIRRELRKWMGFKRRPKISPDSFIRNIKPSRKNELELLGKYNLLSPLEPDCKAAEYLLSRGIPGEVIFHERFKDKIKTDYHNNALFPHFFGKTVVGWEIKNYEFTGFPEGSSKSVWFAEKFKEDKTVIFVESGVEALSYYALFPESLKDVWCVSTAGAWGTRTERMITAALKKYPELELILGFNNDRDGQKYCERIKELAAELKIPSGKIHIKRPEHSDWNDTLIRKGEQLSF